MHFEEAGAGRSFANLFFRGFAHRLYRERQAQGNTSQGMVGVQHHVFRVDIGHGVQGILRAVRIATLGQCAAVEGHSLLDFGGERRTRLQKHQLVIEVSKSLLRLEVQMHAGTSRVALQRIFDGGKQIVAANQKLHRSLQDVQYLAQRVL